MIASDSQSPFSTDGLKPYSRFTLGGGFGAQDEIFGIFGWDRESWIADGCLVSPESCPLGDPSETVLELYELWLEEENQAKSVFDPDNQRLAIGIDFSIRLLALSLQFERDHVTWREVPEVTQGVLAFTARFSDLNADIYPAFDIYFDPLNESLKSEELSRLDTYCRGGGKSLDCPGPMIHILEPPGEGFLYVDLDPEDLVASEWRAVQGHLVAQVDISNLATTAGLYTLILWNSDGTEAIAEYSIVYSPADDPSPTPTPTPPPPPPGERAVWDRPDDIEGPQIHFVYVVPSDVHDLNLDTNGSIVRSVGAIQNWLHTESGGQEFRVDTFNGELDITYIGLEATQFQVYNDPRSAWAQIADEILLLGLPTEDRVFAVYYIGFSEPEACGLGGTTGELRLAVTYLGRGCPSPLASSENRIRSAEHTVIHEIFHALGAVPDCAPNANDKDGGFGHVGDWVDDLMYAGPDPQYIDQAQSLDLGRDDYFGHDNEGCLDIQDSPFLTPVQNG